MKPNKLLSIFSFCLLFALVGCGGGGGSAGVAGNSTGTAATTTPTPTAPAGTSTVTPTTSTSVVTPTSTVTETVTAVVAADFIFELDKQTVVNSGNDKAVLTVLAVDSNRNVVANVPVLVSVDAGAVFSSTTAGTTTNAQGQYIGNITIGGNKANRTINATIKIGAIEKVASILVVGSQLSVTPVPATPAPGQQVTLNLSTQDSAGGAIPNIPVFLAGTSGISGTNTTDLAGIKVTTFIAPAAAGTYTLVASGLGVSTTKVIQVISPAGGGFPNAVGVVSSASLSPQPSSISPNQGSATTSRSKLTVRFLTPNNSGIANMRVRFEIIPPALGSGEVISSGDSVVYSDSSGIADSDYISGSRSSPTNGVLIRACYKPTDFVSPLDCPNFVTTSLTVAGSPLSISISDDNKLVVGLGGIAYVKSFLVQVNDASGVAVKGAIVSVSTDITHYGKGRFGGAYPLGLVAPKLVDPSIAALPVGSVTFVVSPSETVSPGPLSSPYVLGGYFNVWCANEDRNRNGSLDLMEDTNGDGILTPRKAEVIVSYLSGNTTDDKGQLLVQVNYGQNVGRWLSYTLRATTRVAGSEGDAAKSYITDVLEADVANGSFNVPPFGSGPCVSRN
jgi:hypothetical protein